MSHWAVSQPFAVRRRSYWTQTGQMPWQTFTENTHCTLKQYTPYWTTLIYASIKTHSRLHHCPFKCKEISRQHVVNFELNNRWIQHSECILLKLIIWTLSISRPLFLKCYPPPLHRDKSVAFCPAQHKPRWGWIVWPHPYLNTDSS